MQMHISHQLRYDYEDSVLLNPTILRLRPREDHAQQLLEHELVLDPEPVGWDEGLDADGNIIRQVRFEGFHRRLYITAFSRVQTTMSNPFGYALPGADLLRLPLRYAFDDEEAVLAPYLYRVQPNLAVDRFAAEVAEASDRFAPAYVAELTRLLHERCKRIRREHGAPLPPHETLAAGAGACRDTAVLLMDACRAFGLASRFATGYHYLGADSDEPPEMEHELHAWAEVYIPTIGWRGYDPSTGLAVADRHVTLAASADPSAAAVLSGTFSAPPTRSSLRYDVDIEAA